jgi:hypothetical protein
VIDNVPPGTYRLIAWHPQTGPMQARLVTVKPAETVTLSLKLQAPGDRRTAYRLMEPRRFSLDPLGRSLEIVPLVERQH